MTRWVINVGDPVLVGYASEMCEGHVLTKFCFKGSWYYVVSIEGMDTFLLSNHVRPNKKPAKLQYKGRKESPDT